jgi:hypothetical protein
MPRLAYRDEYPWIRCSCGWLLNSESHGRACIGCGEIVEYENVEFLDRFAPTYPTSYILPGGQAGKSIVHPIDVEGREYKPVKYEDRYPASFRVL